MKVAAEKADIADFREISRRQPVSKAFACPSMPGVAAEKRMRKGCELHRHPNVEEAASQNMMSRPLPSILSSMSRHDILQVLDLTQNKPKQECTPFNRILKPWFICLVRDIKKKVGDR